MTIRYFTVFIEMVFIKLIYNIHYFHSQLICNFTVSVSAFNSFFLKKNVYSLCKTYHTEHCRESISLYKAFFRKEIVFKESALFNFKLDSCIHISCHNIHYIRQSICLEILYILGSFCNILYNQS